MKSKMHNFEVNKHLPPDQWEREGKTDWKDYICFTMSRRRAFDMVRDILAQLYESDVEKVELPLFGELSDRVEE